MSESIAITVDGHYDFILVSLSIVIAIFASYTALEFSRYVSQTSEAAYKFWAICGAITMGIGIWAMHFVGMLAFKLPLPVHYDIAITLLSLTVAILVSGFALFVTGRRQVGFYELLFGGSLMGLGIASMHYTGMAAMITEASMSYRPITLSLSIVIAIVVAIVALKIVHNEIKYRAEVIKEYGEIPPVMCLISQINQVFMNLLVNAAHAIETYGKITIRTGVKNDQVFIEISDTGKGIKKENMTKIFEPFFTTKPVGQGTGLGLSLSYGIIKKHNGEIDVTSELNKGTTFRILLPITHTSPPRQNNINEEAEKLTEPA